MNLKWSAIKAVLRQEVYVTKASWEVIFDIFIFTLANIVLFGFIANYLVQGSDSLSSQLQVQSLVVAVVFWEALRINQYSASVSSMWNIWSHNLSNMFIAPIRVTEYLIAHVIAATIKSAFVLVCAIALVAYLFHISILSLGVGPILFGYLNMVIFGTAVGLVLIGLVFRYGTKIQALTWGTIFMIQPFCAVYFPVNVLPGFLQPICYLFPATYFFEWLRALYEKTAYSDAKLLLAFIFNLAYLVAACWIFTRLLANAKRSGQLVRNDL
jgi:ABC-2 type transport system permease protein